MKLTKIIIDEFSSKIPEDIEALLSLPGIGQKSANVIAAELFNAKTLAVDTHVFRVTRRLKLHQEKSPEKAEAALLKIVENKYLPTAHHWFILHGRYTCKAKKPACDQCTLNDLCPSSAV